MNHPTTWCFFWCFFSVLFLDTQKHGSLNVPIEHHPTIRYMVYNGYYKVMSNIPKMGQLPTPEKVSTKGITFCGRPGGPGTFCTQWTSSLLPGGGPESQSGIWKWSQVSSADAKKGGWKTERSPQKSAGLRVPSGNLTVSYWKWPLK